MIIERISDTQVKIILSPTDLSERDINLQELAYGTDKTHELFREMMEQAMMECDFHVDNAPLMIEAIPLAADSIMLVVTKVTESSVQGFSEKLGLLSQLAEMAEQQRMKNTASSMGRCKIKKAPPETRSIFSFADLDDVAKVCMRLESLFSGYSTLIKDDGRYFLILENDPDAVQTKLKKLDPIISEYGQKHVSTQASEFYLREHGEIFLSELAVEKMARLG